MSDALASPRLRRLAQSKAAAREQGAPAQAEEKCDLCSRPVPEQHRHLLDLDSREISCACRACSLLFDKPAAGGGHFRLVPERSYRLEGFELDDVTWESLRIPVDMAFFFRGSREDRVMAYYPSPAGPTESLLDLTAWEEIESANDALGDLEPDVEALLVNRARGARQYFIVPIDDCYRLVGLIRTRWRGFTGGKEVWEAIESFFGDLEQRSRSRQANAASAAEGS